MIIKIGGIKNESTAEVENHFADIIYMQGCWRDCEYCFNSELKDNDGGYYMTTNEVIRKLSPMCEVVVITGGEPLQQLHEVVWLVDSIRKRGNKKIVLETSMFIPHIFRLFDKVLFTFKTWDLPTKVTMMCLKQEDNIIPCVVVGHPQFSLSGFKRILREYGNVNIRYVNDKAVDIQEIYRAVKSRKNRNFMVWKQICL